MSAPLLPDFISYNSRVRPSRRAMVEIATGSVLTYQQLEDAVARCAGLIAALDLGAAPRIALLGRNSVEALVLAFACERAGAIFVPLNWRLGASELAAILADCAPALLVADAEFEPLAREAVPAAPTELLQRERLPGLIAGATPLTGKPAAPDAPLIILYTSGTTGRPKGVVITATNAFYAALNFAFVGEIGPASVALSDLPHFHTIGLVAVSRTTLTLGGTLVVSDRFVPDRTLAALADPGLGVTHYFGVPQMATVLHSAPDFNAAALQRLTAIFLGGAPLAAPLVEDWLADGIPLVNGYGMTEAGTIAHMPIDPATIRRYPGAIGYPSPFIATRLVDSSGADAADGAPGELWLRGPSVTPGYWNQPEATAAAFTDGWLRTGDVLQRDAEGILRLVDRIKDMYISGGENVYPAEIEAVMLSHPALADVAVIGVPHERWGETGVAHVVLRPGAAATATELLAFCEARLARFKRPNRILIVDQIPRTASGKAQKHLLRRPHGADHA